ncbi:MAG TPA: hypothetical protein VK892_10575 [Pyrinomonadaceae bacterium]|nr:hypothetical protein [Pyrinomonadaceae bacterium]
MMKNPVITPKNWLAFELNVLRRLRFDSVALPFTDEPNLGAYLKRSDARVLANDFLPSAYAKSLAQIQNNGEKLSEEQVNAILEDAYVPRYRLQNTALRNWFSETDAWWFDNVRRSIEEISSPLQKAIALNIGLSVGDYIFSFTEETLELRQPLSHAFKRLSRIQPNPVNNGQNNDCTNRTANEFIAENYPDLLFLRLPRAHNQSLKNALGWTAWREEWIRGGDYFWDEMEQRQAGKLGTHVETKSQYLRLIEELLRTSAHIGKWAIAHVEDGFITTQDIVETIANIRRVDTIFTKDFSELTGTKAVIITA